MSRRWKSFILVGVLFVLLLLLGSWFVTKENGIFVKTQSEKQQKSASLEFKNKEEIDQMIKDSHFKGSVLIVNQGQIFYKQSYGYADRQNKVPNKNDSPFPIASLQKMITGSIILELVKEGQLTLETTLDTFYPEIEYSQTITIQDLLNHHSGILMEEKEPENILTDQKSQIDNVLNTLTVVKSKEFMYTNANYTLLAGIISKLTGQTYEENIKKRVIEKLSLTDTYFWDQLPEAETLPQPYYYIEQDYQDDPVPVNEKLFSSLLGAGNLYMSTEDFWVFIQSLTNGQLFKQKEYEQLVGAEQEGYQGGMIYFDGLKYSEGILGGYDTVIYGDQKNQEIVILFANQPAAEGMRELSERLYQKIS
ncbi:serine hydrolase domain-containing protein [Enterococcus caccae]|uniref:Beta-lactamase-related domain-containing protein n=1 Tax=Enterococcus caccae ATCC BAA-1240 TaxID=1158612 RepID=R3WQR8_9ENTE|nr:serine hydrolase domain-containing protein [Enterococcus caccae]EOL44185.1 hypothetical protein UC7_02229 [Enterococcus caccae ATCC BAA-1240]EOT68699.1 hypothetical protein I580_01082 [Enterococcus caccae ATCC BAA-1240]OJG28085.1 hypothetical protein RU98_GL001333 [Enterococcus caccae]